MKYQILTQNLLLIQCKNCHQNLIHKNKTFLGLEKIQKISTKTEVNQVKYQNLKKMTNSINF